MAQFRQPNHEHQDINSISRFNIPRASEWFYSFDAEFWSIKFGLFCWGCMYAVAITLSLIAHNICMKWMVFDAYITASIIVNDLPGWKISAVCVV